jgi:threonine dehydrogenase-like Zn-dependent dehydrogenase
MKISVIESPRNIVIREASLPVIGDEEVLVRLEGTGLCASNLPVWEGREWFKYPFEPGAPGHEGFGVVADLGAGAANLSPGDRVAMLSYHAFAEYDKAPVSDVVKLPSFLRDKPFPGEPAACAVNVFKRCDVGEGQNVVVIGAGYLGCLLIQLLKNAGAHVIAVSRRKTALDYATGAGADEVVSFENFYDALNTLKKMAPDGFPRVVEAAGAQAAVDLATAIIGIRGKLIIAGYHQDGLRNVDMQQWNWKGIDVINAHERDPQTYIRGLKEAVELTEKNILQPEKYITHFIEFEKINDAFSLLKNRPENFLKAVITY